MAVASSNDERIRHVVLLILENRSFNQMLGCFKAVYPDLDGIDPTKPRSNLDDEGRPREKNGREHAQEWLSRHGQ